ncbi:hypothetical protein [Polycladomyces subterraneus]|uniref:Thioredoxin domain-containing protein n=1 Tax=Polycladomyces subterraneus TaxID=1016997 RepID=A0ABT8INS2_9BACL|nr:hypothetical protein [Polycladomyces subterraneus]MDN4594423.1 hypothetical protein [Polycladomyces subterraneus]
MPIDSKRRPFLQWTRFLPQSDRFPLSLHLRPHEILLLCPAQLSHDSRNAYQTLSQRYAIAVMSLDEALPREMWASVRFVLTLEQLSLTNIPYISGCRCLRLVDAGPVEVEETVRYLLGLRPLPS